MVEEHEWIVLGENKGNIDLVSKSGVPAILPKGSFLTVEEDESKFILRVDDSQQNEPYKPNPMVADMDLEALDADRKCQNVLSAFRVSDLNPREDGLIDYIKPQAIARRSTQEEVDQAVGANNEGPPLFLASIYSSQNKLLRDNNHKPLTADMPRDAFFHQMMICGKTGSGKTVASKYLAQYFVEELEGAVLALNVKDVDFLRMDQPSEATTEQVEEEWDALGQEARGMDNFRGYYPANSNIPSGLGVDQNKTEKITLDVAEIDPNSLTGLLKGITDTAAQQLPNIFRYWKEVECESRSEEDMYFSDFIDYFRNAEEDGYEFHTLNSRGEQFLTTMHHSTFQSILRSMNHASEFFDNEAAKSLDEKDILRKGKISVIDVSGEQGSQFGSIVLRDLLDRIVDAKRSGQSDVPILIIIDEVHQFYDQDSSQKALDDLATICRTGRSQEIGVIFSSQNPSDIPKGLSSVINSKIFFKTDAKEARQTGVSVSSAEVSSLENGYALASIHNMPEVNVFKFPLSYAGVF